MAYTLEAIIAKQSLLETHAPQLEHAAVVPLHLGLALIPMTDELLDEIGSGNPLDRFEYLTPALAAWLVSLSAKGPVAYVEAEFFGGIGGQSAVVWNHGDQILPLTHDLSAINIALRLLDISPGASHDEFDAVGLSRHRFTARWLRDALPKTRNP